MGTIYTRADTISTMNVKLAIFKQGKEQPIFVEALLSGIPVDETLQAKLKVRMKINSSYH